MKFPKNLTPKLEIRKQNNALRKLAAPNNLIDFSSNDYIGFSKNRVIFDETHQYLVDKDCIQNGATGSRLLSGNHKIYLEAENYIANFHQSETALIFNSGKLYCQFSSIGNSLNFQFWLRCQRRFF